METLFDDFRALAEALPFELPPIAVAGLVVILVFFLVRYATRPRPKPWMGRRNSGEKPYTHPKAVDLSDPRSQMEYVARVDFEPQPILNKSEYQVLLLLESEIRSLKEGHRVMAQTSMGEIVRPRNGSGRQFDCDLAYRSINSKRLDFVIVDRFGIPIFAVEYQGHGHYKSTSFMRDAVKREVLRKAGIKLIEVPADYRPKDLLDSIRRALQ